MMDLAVSIPNVIRLEIGDPNFQTPRAITEAAFNWALQNRVGYPPNSGMPNLRKAIVDKVRRVNGIACDVANVNVTVGATGALYLALLAAIEPGMEVLVPDPGWAGYPAMVGLAGGIIKTYALPADRGFQLDVAAVERALTDRTGAIIVNSPGNPTGVLSVARSCKSCTILLPGAISGSSPTNATTRSSSTVDITPSERRKRSTPRASCRHFRSRRPMP